MVATVDIQAKAEELNQDPLASNLAWSAGVDTRGNNILSIQSKDTPINLENATYLRDKMREKGIDTGIKSNGINNFTINLIINNDTNLKAVSEVVQARENRLFLYSFNDQTKETFASHDYARSTPEAMAAAAADYQDVGGVAIAESAASAAQQTQPTNTKFTDALQIFEEQKAVIKKLQAASQGSVSASEAVTAALENNDYQAVDVSASGADISNSLTVAQELQNRAIMSLQRQTAPESMQLSQSLKVMTSAIAPSTSYTTPPDSFVTMDFTNNPHVIGQVSGTLSSAGITTIQDGTTLSVPVIKPDGNFNLITPQQVKQVQAATAVITGQQRYQTATPPISDELGAAARAAASAAFSAGARPTRPRSGALLGNHRTTVGHDASLDNKTPDATPDNKGQGAGKDGGGRGGGR